MLSDIHERSVSATAAKDSLGRNGERAALKRNYPSAWLPTRLLGELGDHGKCRCLQIFEISVKGANMPMDNIATAR
jgi:hypothetical protein